jgi:hypothetical protein
MWLIASATPNTKISPFRRHFVGQVLVSALPSQTVMRHSKAWPARALFDL